MEGLIYLVVLFIGYLGIKSLLETYVYKKDKNKRKKTILGLQFLAITMGINAVAYFYFGYTDKNILHVFFVLYAGVFAYHFISFFIIKYKGTEKIKPEKVDNKSDIYVKLVEKIESGKYDLDQKSVDLGNDYSYHPKNDNPFFMLKSKAMVSNKNTNIYDFIMITIISLIVMSLSLPILLTFVDTGSMNSEYLYPLVAFLGAYVLSPFFPDLYYTLVFSKNDDIEFGSFIGFRDNGGYVFGEVMDMNFFFIKIFDHYNKKMITVPHKKFSSTLIDSFSEVDGRIVSIPYVVEIEDIDNLKELIKKQMLEYSNNNTKNLLIDNMTVKYDTHNYGYEVKLRVPIINLKSFGAIS
ncbi:MAG: hypothetical protein U9Q66_04555, partial [Patescibacteria group bacterium]|nr:hypothetical protein [Patescibacteria group bacterium]